MMLFLLIASLVILRESIEWWIGRRFPPSVSFMFVVALALPLSFLDIPTWEGVVLILGGSLAGGVVSVLLFPPTIDPKENNNEH